MKKKTINVIGGILTLFAIVACNSNAEQSSNSATPPPAFPVITVKGQDVTTYQSFPTTIEGVVSSEIRPKVTGYVQKVLVDEGQTVKPGQPLFKLETQSLTQDAAAAKANVNAAQVEVDKLKPLVDKNIISQVQLETAKAKLEQAKSSYNSIIANINYANVTSPIHGIIGTINYREGALVGPQSSLPLTQVAAIENVYAFFSMNEKEYIDFISSSKGNTLEDKIKNLPKVSLELANGSTYQKEGIVETISGNIDQRTGTVTFRAKFNNQEGVLRNGSSGTIKIPKIHNNSIVVPSESTFEKQGKTFVYTVMNDSIVQTPISITSNTNKLYVVESGLNQGDNVLAKGITKVRPGMHIKPLPTSIDSILESFSTVFK
ncbi:efflux RND transporter periplasmic adaptor subunit [Mangrovimonas aestuarii]|uniref:efflux RND transporter periplasmic adaptor subunit n=1 Tax=Mangrovimonas aestuarii TaxID=3018443 RepID=UPI0023782D8E|nr:efflux RND transporter periplasmic adaptor subunit [Mangrovimonas aestuarii]